MADNGVQLVIFDLGGVLIRIADGWAHACERAGFEPTQQSRDPQLAQRVVPLARQVDSGQITCRQLLEQLAPLVGMTTDQMHHVHMAYIIEPYDGIDGVIDAVHSAGVGTACLSNTNGDHWDVMTARGLDVSLPLDRLDHLFASFQLGLAKPDEAIYRHVERTVGLPGEAMLFFDDSQPNIDAAHRCGWRAERIDAAGDSAAQMMHHLHAHGVLM